MHDLIASFEPVAPSPVAALKGQHHLATDHSVFGQPTFGSHQIIQGIIN